MATQPLCVWPPALTPSQRVSRFSYISLVTYIVTHDAILVCVFMPSLRSSHVSDKVN